MRGSLMTAHDTDRPNMADVLASDWLAEHDRQVAAKALREAAELVAPFSGIGMGMCPARSEWSAWLNERADRIEADETGGA